VKIETTPLPGVLVIHPRVYRDSRGFFLESFNADRFAEHGLPTEFRQDNHSHSVTRVLRGLHYQLRRPHPW
jgi:dTDP-4-dehydrorhamnose 3,5-epimerase